MKSIYCVFVLIGLAIRTDCQMPTISCEGYGQPISSDKLPRLPEQFQSRIESSLFAIGQTGDSTLVYDIYGVQAEIVANDNNEQTKILYDFKENELFRITDTTCYVENLNESSYTDTYFGYVDMADGFNMKNPTEVLHFNNNNSVTYKDSQQTTWRGIPVNHYVSCQNIPFTRSLLRFDYYFKVPEFKKSVTFEEEPEEVPVAFVVEGYTNINADAGTFNKIKNEYNFFQFRLHPSRMAELTKDKQPEGYFCEGQTRKEQPPKIPDTFTLTEEVIINGVKTVATMKLNYNYPNKVVRYDFISPRSSTGVNVPFKLIQDFNSGIEYKIDKGERLCEINPLGSSGATGSILMSGSNSALKIKSPMEMFALDDSYFYVGERFERGIRSNVFVSKNTKFQLTGLLIQPEFWVFEISFKSRIRDGRSGAIESEAPLSLRVTSADQTVKITTHIYNFDSSDSSMKAFDVSQCYEGKERKDFAIKFDYSENMTKEAFKYYSQSDLNIENSFYTMILNLLSEYAMSPLRIVYPSVRAQDDGFTIFTGVTKIAEPIKHFTKKDRSRVDISKSVNVFPAMDPESCARLCLSPEIKDDPFQCLSFDFCLDTKFCSFYNFSLTTDPNVVSPTASYCDHYSKTVVTFDSVNNEELYRTIEDSISRNELNLTSINGIDNSFFAREIFPATLDAETDSAGMISFETGTVFTQFSVLSGSMDFDLDQFSKRPDLQLRKKDKVKYEDCGKLCLDETTFSCESMSYNEETGECKWSSFIIALNILNTTICKDSDGFTLFYRDPIFDFEKYPGMTSSKMDDKLTLVDNIVECAFNCIVESSFACRSINVCDQKDGKFKCLLSKSHANIPGQSADLVYNPVCTHYSRKSVFDFKILTQTQLDLTPEAKYLNVSVQLCAQICTYMDSFECRSFDFFTDSKTCFLYKENFKDSMFENIKEIKNPNCNHYSKTKTDAKSPNKAKYSGGLIFGVVFGVAIAGLVIGFGSIFAYLRFMRKKNELPAMEFVNPNYKK